jgi:hypothetical protein
MEMLVRGIQVQTWTVLGKLNSMKKTTFSHNWFDTVCWFE